MPMQTHSHKLTDAEKKEIVRIYQSGVCGTRPIAKQFGVNRTTIRKIVGPKKDAKATQ